MKISLNDCLLYNDSCKALSSPTINQCWCIHSRSADRSSANLDSILLFNSFYFAWAGSSLWNHHLNCSEEFAAWHNLHSDSGASISWDGGKASFREWKNKLVHVWRYSVVHLWIILPTKLKCLAVVYLTMAEVFHVSLLFRTTGWSSQPSSYRSHQQHPKCAMGACWGKPSKLQGFLCPAAWGLWEDGTMWLADF